MTLNQTWKNCLQMWKWIDRVWEPGIGVTALKKQWMRMHLPTISVTFDCFFCDYDEVRGEKQRCVICPGRLVSNRFRCEAYTSYHWRDKPKQFYKKLLQLDAKRTQK